ncbi:ERF family protein [Yangia mangrovi]|uniref:ERF family protein n=1 Tax=Alloyangia mangrovi TaxID=1779329 RepID=A0A2A3K2S8_9RHOB|nr:ERF family protein [Alloyangia mangrovi]MCT4369082.1 ERF family protein [Alloyangia mangrovi]
MNAVVEHQTRPTGEVVHIKDDPMVAMIERIVLNPDADLDKLERMLAMKERMDAQSAKVAFAKALSGARSSFPPIHKDAMVDFTSAKGRTHYRHETLAGIAKVIDPVMAEHGLSYRFRTDQASGGVKVTCVIAHADGHSEETSLFAQPDTSGNKNGFQSIGSAVTYLQRYTLKAALGLSAEVDDDAHAADPIEDNGPGREPHRSQRREQHQEQRGPNARQVADKMIASIREVGADRVDADERFRKEFSRLQTLASDEANRVQRAMQEWRDANASGPQGGGYGDIDEIPY